MTALSIPVALAIALRCAPAADPGMLVAIARQESGLEPLTLHDDTSGQVLRGAGVIEIGEAPDRRRSLGRPRRLADQQPQPGAAGSGRRRCVRAVQSRGGAARLLELFSRYNTGSPSRGIANGYAAAVMAAIHTVKTASQAMPRPTTDAGQLPISAPDPFAMPSRTGPSLVFTTKGE